MLPFMYKIAIILQIEETERRRIELEEKRRQEEEKRRLEEEARIRRDMEIQRQREEEVRVNDCDIEISYHLHCYIGAQKERRGGT